MKNTKKTIYEQAEQFARLDKKTILSENRTRVKNFLNTAEQLLVTGTREGIASVYVYSVYVFLEIRHYNVSDLFPVNLRREYLKQIKATSV